MVIRYNSVALRKSITANLQLNYFIAKAPFLCGDWFDSM